MFGDDTVKALDDGFAFSSVFQSEKGAMSSGGDRRQWDWRTIKMQDRGDFLPSSALSLFFIITRSFQEALISPQLILTWIRDNKQPINGGLNQEMELESAAQFGG